MSEDHGASIWSRTRIEPLSDAVVFAVIARKQAKAVRLHAAAAPASSPS